MTELNEPSRAPLERARLTAQALLDSLLQLTDDPEVAVDELRALSTWVDERIATLGAKGRTESDYVLASTPAPGAAARAESVAGDEDARAHTERSHELSARDLERVAERAWLKVEACEVALARKRDEEIEDSALPHDPEALLRDASRLRDCYLWPLVQRLVARVETVELACLRGCYANLAQGAEIAAEWSRRAALDEAPPLELLELVAEAQSAVNAGVEPVKLRFESDVQKVFVWLRRQTDEHRIYVARHMRRTDPADPGAFEDLETRLEDYSSRVEGECAERDARLCAIGDVRTALRELDEDSDADAWKELVDLLEEWAESGRALSDATLAGLLAPHVDGVPDSVEVTAGAQGVLAAARERNEGRPARSTAAAADQLGAS